VGETRSNVRHRSKDIAQRGAITIVPEIGMLPVARVPKILSKKRARTSQRTRQQSRGPIGCSDTRSMQALSNDRR